jgi:hypothetical protein
MTDAEERLQSRERLDKLAKEGEALLRKQEWPDGCLYGAGILAILSGFVALSACLVLLKTMWRYLIWG